MAAVEQPFGGMTSADTFTIGNAALRSAYQNSFYLPQPITGQYYLNGGPAIVNGSAGNVTMGISADDGALIGIGQTGGINGIYQLYIQDNGSGPNGVFAGVTNLTPTFPANTIPIAVIVYDEVGRISQLIDERTSYLSSVPTYATGASENIASPTLRAGYIANFAVPRTYALSPSIPPDVNLPYSSFALGAGSVVISGNVITTESTVFTSTARPLSVYGIASYNF